MNALLGGCLCGYIRYRVEGQPYDVSHCHCQDCRRAGGTAFVTWASASVANFTVIAGELSTVLFATRFRSFCPKCGTQLTFSEGPDSPEIDFTVSSLDAPQSLTPTDHIWTEDRLPWIHLADDLPQHLRERK